MKRLFIVGDDAFMVHAMRFALRYSSGVNLFGVIDGRRSVRQAVREAQPDIVVVDGLGDSDAGLERIREVHEEAPSAVLMLLSSPLDDPELREVLDAGAMVCISKALRRPNGERSAEGAAAPRHAVATETTTEVAHNGNGHGAAPGQQPDAEHKRSPLTARELEILRAVAEGHTNARIGRQLWVTEQTVKFHLSNIYRKLGVSNRTQASRYALTHGLAGSAARRATITPYPNGSGPNGTNGTNGANGTNGLHRANGHGQRANTA